MEREYVYGTAGMIGGYVTQNKKERKGLASTVTKKNIKLDYSLPEDIASPFTRSKASLNKVVNGHRSNTDISGGIKNILKK